MRAPGRRSEEIRRSKSCSCAIRRSIGRRSEGRAGRIVIRRTLLLRARLERRLRIPVPRRRVVLRDDLLVLRVRRLLVVLLEVPARLVEQLLRGLLVLLA